MYLVQPDCWVGVFGRSEFESNDFESRGELEVQELLKTKMNRKTKITEITQIIKLNSLKLQLEDRFLPNSIMGT